MANQLGKRYECGSCGAVLLCTKAGSGAVACCGEPMQMLTPRKLPSTD